ncbi:hypothetical protein BVI434_1370003 [Burkholderia vietnamiensis]|nr:hypothetical protein BVI2075_160069 [Burkholderia vietnamiensis]CAG9196588.1 hypothetical protein BVI434_1370003 [Burkholderia vietnamiensis]CAG9224163.1 hypothetical protein BVI1335_500032 [Burkholderia vietnamiensis]
MLPGQALAAAAAPLYDGPLFYTPTRRRCGVCYKAVVKGSPHRRTRSTNTHLSCPKH